ncbi:acetate--CoA ligase [Geoglobus acetivorans]|uniref:Acetate--CoA ligase n=1 Tax=Geoglobus acetivorans TaxID=565033 RepID=A0A0A7GDQ3_GEOAI|nr:acetyl-CoA synthetase [Geoglobus acetivorans]
MKGIYPSKEFVLSANVRDPAIYSRASENWVEFWEDFARELEWFEPWYSFLDDSRAPFYRFFVGGKINACYNCVDRHAEKKNKAAIIWEGENGESRIITYYQLYKEVNAFSSALKELGVKQGSKVALYMPNLAEAVIAMLACARIGATHIYIFEGFSAKSAAYRLRDSRAEYLITADGYFRRGRLINLKEKADEACDEYGKIKKVIVVRRAKNEVSMVEERDHWYHDLLIKKDASPEVLDSNHPLFIMYTSGSTAEPKGIVHSTGGYLVHVYATSKMVLDLKPDDIIWTTASLGWITGHSYGVYGPLAVGATTLLYEGAPDYPDICRIFDIIEKYGVTVFYTVPTLARMINGCDISGYDLSSLRLIGSVGEPIDPETWSWLYGELGRKKIPLVNTWWQTETGGHVLSQIPALTPMKPASVGKALPGIEVDIIDDGGKKVKPFEIGNLVIKKPFPGIMLEINGDTSSYIKFYWTKYGKRVYFTGDSAYMDDEGHIWIVGRVDDVINISGHRVSLIELEHAVMEIQDIREVAAVGLPDRVKGSAIALFVVSSNPGKEVAEKITEKIERDIGKIAHPALIVFTPELPRAGGKILRRAIYEAVVNKKISSVVSNPDSVEKLMKLKPSDRGVIVIQQ